MAGPGSINVLLSITCIETFLKEVVQGTWRLSRLEIGVADNRTGRRVYRKASGEYNTVACALPRHSPINLILDRTVRKDVQR